MTAPPSKIDRNRRIRDALELRKAGVPYATIAERLGWKSAQAAHKAVKKALDSQINESVEDLRSMEIERLNHMLMLIWARIQQGICARLSKRCELWSGLPFFVVLSRGLKICRSKRVASLSLTVRMRDEYIASLEQ